MLVTATTSHFMRYQMMPRFIFVSREWFREALGEIGAVSVGNVQLMIDKGLSGIAVYTRYGH